MRAAGGDKLYPQYLLTHPYHESRIINLEKKWARKPPSVDTSLFPYIVARTKIILKYRRSGLVEDEWLRRYARDGKDPVAAYGASLYYSLKGNFKEAIEIAEKNPSPYRDLFLGEIYVAAHRFPEAVKVLKDTRLPIGRYFLARAYEGMGNNTMAVKTFQELTSFAPAFPDIYYRLGMILGRSGNEAAGHAYLGRFYVHKGNYMLAKTNLEKAISRYGINSRESAELMRLLDSLEDKDEK